MKLNLKSGNENGFVLLSIIMLTVILEGYAATSLVGQLQEIRLARYNQMKSEAMYAAQGVADRGLALLALSIASFSVTDITNNQSYNVTYSDGRTVGSYRIMCVTPDTSLGCSASARENCSLDKCQRYVITDNGVQKTVQDYEIIATANHPDNTGFSSVLPITASSTVHQVAQLKQTSIFSYSIFYNSDLEMLPGPNMIMTGQIHANGDMYLASQTAGNYLRLDSSFVHATGDMYHRRKDNPNAPMPGDVQIRKSGTSGACSSSTCPSMTFDSSSATWAADATTTWNGSVQSSDMGVQFIQPVTIPSIQPSGFYYNNAGLRIENGTVSKRQANGTYADITSDPCMTSVANSGGVTGAVINTNAQFRNVRENASYNVIVTDIDMDRLIRSSCYPSNGLIYATRTNAMPANGQTQATSHGVRLINGSQATPTGTTAGLTMVTNDPLYVKGDLNNPVNPANRRSVALISDALNILSNAWTDANSTNTLANRVATNTTVNAGFVSGVVPTAGSQYSGGLENYPRFLEKWTGITASIGGAFINLWNSSIGTGQWIPTGTSGNSYNAPVRSWAYDSGLQSTPPPFTPIGVEVVTSNWGQEAKELIYL